MSMSMIMIMIVMIPLICWEGKVSGASSADEAISASLALGCVRGDGDEAQACSTVSFFPGSFRSRSEAANRCGLGSGLSVRV